MSGPTTPNDEEQIRKCSLLMKTMNLLASSSGSFANVDIHETLTKEVCLQMIRDRKKQKDDLALVDTFYEVMTRYIFQYLPDERKPCSHHISRCWCFSVEREKSVYVHLRHMGIDVDAMRSQIDAAFIRTLEKPIVHQPFESKKIDQTPQRPVVRKKRNSNTSNRQLARRIRGTGPSYVPLYKKVFIEYVGKPPFRGGNSKNIWKPRRGAVQEM